MIVYYGGFWQRFLALSIDTIILYIYTIIMFLIGNLIAPQNCGLTYLIDTPSTFMYTVFFPYYGLAVLLNASYFIYFHGATGQTPGKRLLGLRVVRTDGKPLTYGIAFLRWIGYILSKLPFFLGFIWAAFDSRKQGWHDKIAGTCVIKTHRYQKIPDHVSPDARFEPNRCYHSAGEDITSGNGSGYGSSEENRSDSENT